MNFLAHLHLADPDPGLMLGGVAADFARNPEVAVLPPDVRAGVRLHRLIDGFTDRHPVVLRSVGRISGAMGWFSSIVIDIYYDHILGRDWGRYSAEPLRAFADRAYRTLEARLGPAESDTQWFVHRLIAGDYLTGYATPDGIAAALTRVSQTIAERIPNRAVALTDALPLLAAADADLAADFHAFYPELQAFAAERRRSGL